LVQPLLGKSLGNLEKKAKPVKVDAPISSFNVRAQIYQAVINAW
jgi:hypothetical protein